MSGDFRTSRGSSCYETIFLSDIHLGTRGCQAEKLLCFLKSVKCKRLYLVGDIIDGWRLRSSFYWPLEHQQVVNEFIRLSRTGTQVCYVTGNHDEFLRAYSDFKLGNIELVDEAIFESTQGKSFLVVHGDQFDVVTRCHRWIALLGDVGYTFLLVLNRYFNSFRAKFGFGYWSLSAWIKHRVKKAVNFVNDYESSVSRECKRRGFGGVICGHIHHAEIRSIGEIAYMNCGDWVESCTALVQTFDGHFQIIDSANLVPSASIEMLPLVGQGLENVSVEDGQTGRAA